MKKNIIATLRSRGLVNVAATVTSMGWVVKANLPVPADLRGCKCSIIYHDIVAEAMDDIDFNVDGFVTEDFYINSENDYEFTLIPATEETIRKFMVALIRTKCAYEKEDALGALFYMTNRISDDSKRKSAKDILMNLD